MANFIKLYNGNVSEGQKDGVEITVGEDKSNPLLIEVSTKGDEVAVDIAIRTAVGYKTSGTTTLSFVGDTANLWAFEYKGAKKAFGEALEITEEILDVNTMIKVYSKALTSEEIKTDEAVKINLQTLISSI